MGRISPRKMELSNMIYFNTWEVFIGIDDLKTTPKLLLIWIVGYSQARIPFEFTNKQIGENFRICEGTAKAAVKELKNKEYIDVDKPGSPLRKLKWADKAKAIYRVEKRKAEEAKERKPTSIKNNPVEKHTSIKNIPVTSTKNHPQPVQKTYHSIVNSNNYNNSDAKASVCNKNISASTSSGSKHFRKPTPAEVAEYAKSIDYQLDGDAFCDYYDSVGWSVGKKPMKNWQACVRTWKHKHTKDDNTVDHWQPPTLEQVEQIKKQCAEQYAGESHGH
jgi:hypothetical protein